MAGQQSEIAVGIDLGTTYSCVAVWQRNRVAVILNDQGFYVTPSCVAFAGSEKLVGNSAFNQAASNPSNTVFAIKRLMGRRWEEQSVQDDMKLWPFRVVQGRAGRPMVLVQFKDEEKKFTAEQISSMILVKLKEIAEAFLGCTVKNAVITVPAYFNDSQRRATKDAGEIAGLTVMRVINEPTAAAFAYGLDKMSELGSGQKYILIFDLGGGTLDVTILLMKQDLLEVKSTAGNPHLGGEDFDSRMVSYMAREFKKREKLDISENPRALRRLRTACEKAKRVLSFQHMTTVEVDSLMGGIDLHIDITRAKFEELNADLFDNCKVVLEQCISDLKGVTKDSIDDVVLVGGSTRIPKIQNMLKEYFNREVLCMSINPDEAVAQGAAIQAAKLTGVEDEEVNSLVLLDVTPLSLGVETRGGVMTVLVDRNTPVPVKRERVFSTAVDDQTCVEVKVFQGERTLTKDNHLLGVFTLEGLLPMPERVPHINISFEIDANGILTVTAEERSIRLKKEMVVANDYGRLTTEEIERMVRDGETYRRDDELRRKLVEARNALEAYISSVKHKLQGGKLSLSSREKEKVQAALDRASEWFERNPDAEARQYDDARKELERVWTDVVGSRS